MVTLEYLSCHHARQSSNHELTSLWCNEFDWLEDRKVKIQFWKCVTSFALIIPMDRSLNGTNAGWELVDAADLIIMSETGNMTRYTSLHTIIFDCNT